MDEVLEWGRCTTSKFFTDFGSESGTGMLRHIQTSARERAAIRHGGENLARILRLRFCSRFSQTLACRIDGWAVRGLPRSPARFSMACRIDGPCLILALVLRLGAPAVCLPACLVDSVPRWRSALERDSLIGLAEVSECAVPPFVAGRAGGSFQPSYYCRSFWAVLDEAVVAAGSYIGRHFSARLFLG